MELMMLICTQAMTADTCTVVLKNDMVQFVLGISGLLFVWFVCITVINIFNWITEL